MRLPAILLTGALAAATAAEPIRLGFNYPETGPYAAQGLDQRRAAELAVEEVNAAGGILGRPVTLAVRDSQSKPAIATRNARELIDHDGVAMLFGGVSSAVAVAVGQVAQERGVPFFATLSYSTETTCEQGHRFTFRECYDSYAAAQVLGDLLRERFAGKRYLYVTADYTWGRSTEDCLRQATGSDDRGIHKGIRTRFPGA